MYNIPPKNYDDVVGILTDGEMIKKLQVRAAIDYYHNTGNPRKIEKILEHKPWIYTSALANIAKKKHLQDINPFAPHPSNEEVVEYLSGDIELGQVNRFMSWWFKFSSYVRICIVIGKIRSGKSVLIKLMLKQILQDKRNFNTLIWDIAKREYRGLIINCENVKLISKELLKINPLEVPECRTIREHVYDIAELIVSMLYLGGISYNIIVGHLLKLYKQHGCFEGSKDWPSILELNNSIIEARDSSKISFKMLEIYNNIENRLTALIQSEIVDCIRGLPIELFQTTNLIIECDYIGDNVRNFLIAYVVRIIFRINIAKGFANSSLRTLIVVDECRSLLEAHRDISFYGESSFNIDSSRVGAPGIGMLLGTQDSPSISTLIRANAHTLISFKQTDGVCLDWLQAGLSLSDDQRKYVSEKMAPVGVAVCKYGDFPRPFLLVVPDFQLPIISDLSELEPYQHDFWDEIKQYIVLENCGTANASSSEPAEILPPAAITLLYLIIKNPFLSLSELSNTPVFKNATQIQEPRKWLVDHEYVSEQTFQISGTRPSIFLIPTQKASKIVPFKDISGHGGFYHSLCQDRVFHWLLSRNYTATKEGKLSNGKAVDVLTNLPERGHVGIEITIHFNNLIQNIVADFNGGCDLVVIITASKDAQQRAMELVDQDSTSRSFSEKILFRTISSFLGEE